MDPLMLSRIQFGITTSLHFLFVPMSIGLGFTVALLETLYVFKKDEMLLTMAKFWGRIFMVSVAMGVATGIMLSFQFGLNWSKFSSFAGDVFGPPFAIETWLAFSIESVFIGIWIFGWKKVPPALHAFSAWMITFGSFNSAFWVLVVNAFMQDPTGYVVRNGRLELVDFVKLITSQQVFLQVSHTILACLVTSAFLMIAVCAWHFLKKTREAVFFHRSLLFAVVIGLVSLLGVMGVGHQFMIHVGHSQPMKLAAAEGLWETTDQGGESIFAIIDEKNRRNIFELKVPYVLNLLMYGKLKGTVRGIHDLQKEYEERHGPGNYIPPVNVSYWSFRVMVGSAMGMLLLLTIVIWLYRARRYTHQPLLLKAMLFSIVLPHLSNISGWLLTEMGRQPWVIYGIMLTKDGLTPKLSLASAATAIVLFTLAYLIMTVLGAYFMARFAAAQPSEAIKDAH